MKDKPQSQTEGAPSVGSSALLGVAGVVELLPQYFRFSGPLELLALASLVWLSVRDRTFWRTPESWALASILALVLALEATTTWMRWKKAEAASREQTTESQTEQLPVTPESTNTPSSESSDEVSAPVTEFPDAFFRPQPFGAPKELVLPLLGTLWIYQRSASPLLTGREAASGNAQPIGKEGLYLLP